MSTSDARQLAQKLGVFARVPLDTFERIESMLLTINTGSKTIAELCDELDRQRATIAALEKERDELKAGQFWERLFANREDFPDGMTAEAVKNELADYHFIMEQVPKVYDAVTGGLLSKTNYYAASVIAAFEEHVQRLVDDEINDRAALTASADKPETHNGTV